MPHLLLIVEPVGQREARSADEGQSLYQAMLDYTDELRTAGVLLATSSLSRTATRVESRGGQARLIDGPFAEAREMVGGFFLIDCDRDDALAWARRCPAAGWSSVEVRETGPCST